MLKKNLIVCILIFFYSIVLGHSAIPHGHFDDFFFANHEHESHEHSHNDHDPDSHEHSHDHSPYLFSHSISLHVAVEKQPVFSAHPQKITTKNTQPDSSVSLLPQLYQACSISGTYFLQGTYNSGPPLRLNNHSIISRGPPSES